LRQQRNVVTLSWGGGGCKLVDSKSLNGSMVFTASFSCSPYHYAHVQDLTSQVSAETDPVSLLPKVVSLLYIQVSLFRLLCFCWLFFVINMNCLVNRFTIKLFKPLEGPFLLLFLDWRYVYVYHMKMLLKYVLQDFWVWLHTFYIHVNNLPCVVLKSKNMLKFCTRKTGIIDKLDNRLS
jgi:hypothetical protein